MNARDDFTRRMRVDLLAATRAIEKAVEKRDRLIRQAVEANVPRADIAAATGLTRQRIYQIVRDTRDTTQK